MVCFICDACGNSVKKTQVEKHYSTVCRSCKVLSCLDCGIDFPGNSYLKHTSCVTEAEKYQGHLYQAKEKENKGETKQKEWLKNVHGTTSNTNDPKLKVLLKRLSAYSNIPRKKKKFENFCKNSVNVRDTKTLDQLWDLFNASNEKSNAINESSGCAEECKEDSTDSTSETSANETTEILNGSDCKLDTDSQMTTKKKKKRKHLDEKMAVENGDVTNVVNDGDNTNENEESVTKIKKKKKNKHLINGDTGCNGESHDTQVNNSMDTSVDRFQDKVENGQEIDHETNTKSKKKKKKHKQVSVEDKIEGVSEIELQHTQKKPRKSKRKKDLSDEIHDYDANGDKETENRQGDKKRKKGKKYKLKEETIEAGNIEVKKRKKEQNGAIEGDEETKEEDIDTAPQGKFNWHKTIKTVLKESEDHELSLKKLKKKVLNAYQEHGIDHRAPTMNESRALFDKKLKSYPKVKILKDRVKLVK